MLERRTAVYPNALPLNPPPDWETWVARAMGEAEGRVELILSAWDAYLVSDWAQERRPVAPVIGFMSGNADWRSYVPGQAEGARLPASAGPPRLTGTRQLRVVPDRSISSQVFVPGEVHTL
jgi:hypothetical protein